MFWVRCAREGGFVRTTFGVGCVCVCEVVELGNFLDGRWDVVFALVILEDYALWDVVGLIAAYGLARLLSLEEGRNSELWVSQHVILRYPLYLFVRYKKLCCSNAGIDKVDFW
jgi:hypothetical protein